MNHTSFKEKRLGERYEEVLNYGFECVAICKKYIEEVYQKEPRQFGGSAISGWVNNRNTFQDDWVRIKNIYGDATNFPSQGDIIFWGPTEENKYGHVAIVDSANGSRITVIEQNGATGSSTGLGDDAIRLFDYGYTNILGWFTPVTKNADTPSGEGYDLVKLGIWNGKDPHKPASRLQVATMLERMSKLNDQQEILSDIQYQCNHEETDDYSNEDLIIKDIDGIITYKVHNDHPEIDDTKEELMFNNVFTYIQDRVYPIRFKRVRGKTKAQVNIYFAKNGDKHLPKKFKSSSIAFAYLPRTSRRGEIYINLDNDFIIGGNGEGEEGLKVLTHELLHCIWGVRHSEDQESVMYYKNLKNKRINLPLIEKMSLRRKIGAVKATNTPLVFI